MHGIELAVMALLGLLVLLLIVRPMLRRILAPAGNVGARALAAAGAGVLGASGMTLPGGTVIMPGMAGGSITTAAGPNVSIVGSDEQVAISNRTSAMIDIAQVQGQVHAQSVQKVGELADKNPNETVSIIRTWLHDHAA
jgi:flagellar M-ring protein FliF